MVGRRIVEVVEEVEGKVEEEEKDKEEEIVEVEEHPSGQGTASTDTSFPHFTITNKQHSLPLTCQTLFLSNKNFLTPAIEEIFNDKYLHAPKNN